MARAPRTRTAPDLGPPRSDRDLGIRADRNVPLSTLAIDSANQVHGNRYEPTPYGVLDDMLLDLGLDHPRFTFVDLGSGKGRVLCQAATLPFRKVVGIEFSPELHAIAEANIAAMSPERRRCRQVRSVLGDAAEHPLADEPTVIFLFNPFAAPVLARVVDNIERCASPELYVLYYMPVWRSVIDRRDTLRVRSESRDWVVYARDQSRR